MEMQWNITIFNRKHIFNPGPLSIAMLVYRSGSLWTAKPFGGSIVGSPLPMQCMARKDQQKLTPPNSVQQILLFK